jgi:hypothetical protein
MHSHARLHAWAWPSFGLQLALRNQRRSDSTINLGEGGKERVPDDPENEPLIAFYGRAHDLVVA